MRLTEMLIIAIIILSGIGYWYYQGSQERITTLLENNNKLIAITKTQEDTMAFLEESYRKVSEQLNQVNQDLANSRRQNRLLSERLENIDLGTAALVNPKGIERAVNRGTKNANRCFELLSGAELNQQEKEATDAETFNKECPWLWPGNVNSNSLR